MKERKGQQTTGKTPLARTKKAKAELWNYYPALCVILLISFIAYLPVWHNQLVNFDDDRYIQFNSLVHSFNLKGIFSQYVEGNYHPFTMLTLAIEYHFFGLDATGYHAVNLLLHLLNTILVFYVILSLSNKVQVALIASLLFGIHPLHVESVAWAAELKDLLYTFFFLGSYILYLKYLKALSPKFYLFALLLFLFSLFSKAMAASLPVVLLLTDFFRGRKINLKVLLEKLPFFLLAATFGVVALFAQRSSNSIQDLTFYTLPQRMVFACYGFIMYLYKLVLPLNLCALYPYPVKNDVPIPVLYYGYVLLLAAIIAVTIYSLKFSKKIFFGVAFFTITVFLVLQLLPVGGVVMADRYSYIPSIGIFYLAAEGIGLLWNRKLKIPAIALLSILSVFFSVATYARTTVWKNSMSLWNDVINKYPDISYAYYDRGTLLMNESKNEEALSDFSKAVELKPDYIDAYNNLGSAYYKLGKFNQALDNFSKAVHLQPNYTNAYYNRAVMLMAEGKNEEAINDFNIVISQKPANADAYNNRGIVLMNEKKNEEAQKDFNKSIELAPDSAKAYNNLGALLMNEGKYDEALTAFTKATQVNPNYASAYNNTGLIYSNQKKYDEAINNYSKAISLNPGYAEAYFNRAKAEYNSGKNDAICPDLKQAAAMGYQPAIDAARQQCK